MQLCNDISVSLLSHSSNATENSVNIDEMTDSLSFYSDENTSKDIRSGHVQMISKLRRQKGQRFTTSWGPEGFKKSLHPLSVMV